MPETAPARVRRFGLPVGVAVAVLAGCGGSSGVVGGSTTTAAPTTVASPSTAASMPGSTVAATTAPATPPPPTTSPPASAVGVPVTCPTWSGANVTGTGSEPLDEVSGLAVGRQNPDLLWTHNDSGDTARVFAIDQRAHVVTTVSVAGARALDWEDIAIGPGPPGDARPWIWVSDTGDNFHLRPVGTIYRFPEPDLGASPPAQLTVPAERIDVTYPNGANNVEGLMVDPATGDGFLVSKDVESEQMVAVYRLPREELHDGARLDLQAVARVVGRTDQRDGPTSADISPDGTLVLVSNGRHGFLWPRDPARPVAEVLSAAPTAPCEAPIGGGEAVAFSVDGRHLWATNEGESAKLRRYDREVG